jgi:GAF domain-containing protein
MPAAEGSDWENARVDAVRRYDVLDTPPETAFDDLARVAALVCHTPVALVSLIDDTRQWFKARIGIEAQQTPRSVAFCDHAIRSPDQVMVVPDATADPRLRDNPLVTGAPNIRFYAGAPLVTGDGFPLGTLCAIDQRPRTLTPEQTDALAVLARQVMTQLELRRANAALQEVLNEGRLPPECAVTLCPWTCTLQVAGGPWVSVETFLRDKVGVRVVHGLSDEAVRRLGPRT